LVDTRATRTNVIATLRQVAGRVKATDQVVVYFAGHAVCLQNPRTKADEYYLLPHGASLTTMKRQGLSTKKLGELLGLIRAEELIVVLDCCHAGGVSAGLGQLQWNPAALNDVGAGYKNFYVMAAANGHQEVI